MKIVYFSKGLRGSQCLSRILEAGYVVKTIVAVDQEQPLDEIARKYDLPIIYPENINSDNTITQLKTFNADLFILCGYNKILKQPIIEIPPLGTINLHGGKLPEYRGAAPINWQIINGETTGGCSIIYVDEGIDTGDIIAQEIYQIDAGDTHASILEKTLDIFPRLLLDVLEQIENGTVQPQKQDPSEGGYFPRRYPKDSEIIWAEMTDIEVHNLVRGMHGPYPAAYTNKAGEKIEIDKTELIDETITGVPGRVAGEHKNGIIVLAKNRGLLISSITVDGKEIDPKSFLGIGDDLGTDIREDGKNE